MYHNEGGWATWHQHGKKMLLSEHYALHYQGGSNVLRMLWTAKYLLYQENRSTYSSHMVKWLQEIAEPELNKDKELLWLKKEQLFQEHKLCTNKIVSAAYQARSSFWNCLPAFGLLAGWVSPHSHHVWPPPPHLAPPSPHLRWKGCVGRHTDKDKLYVIALQEPCVMDCTIGL